MIGYGAEEQHGIDQRRETFVFEGFHFNSTAHTSQSIQMYLIANSCNAQDAITNSLRDKEIPPPIDSAFKLFLVSDLWPCIIPLFSNWMFSLLLLLHRLPGDWELWMANGERRHKIFNSSCKRFYGSRFIFPICSSGTMSVQFLHPHEWIVTTLLGSFVALPALRWNGIHCFHNFLTVQWIRISNFVVDIARRIAEPRNQSLIIFTW